MRDVTAFFLSNGHFAKITNLSLANKIGQIANFFTFPLVLSHRVQHIQKLQNSMDKKKNGAGILENGKLVSSFLTFRTLIPVSQDGKVAQPCPSPVGKSSM